MKVNDRAVNLLEQYDLEVLRTRKGRGAILCETSNGLYILKEYKGSLEKLLFQDKLLKNLKEQGCDFVEQIIPTKEGEMIVTDFERTNYVLKTYFEGKECNINDNDERLDAVRFLAELHKKMLVPKDTELYPKSDLLSEFEKRNRELKRVKRFLKEKSQKNGFEIYLMQNYDMFFSKALEVTQKAKEVFDKQGELYFEKETPACHGDFQYHNLLKTEKGFVLVNFEKCIVDYPVRDLYFFIRKVLEKNSFSKILGEELVKAYRDVYGLTVYEALSLYYRFAYPEKFWKIVNFYYNNRKVWVPDKICEKLAKLIMEEENRQSFLDYLSEIILEK